MVDQVGQLGWQRPENPNPISETNGVVPAYFEEPSSASTKGLNTELETEAGIEVSPSAIADPSLCVPTVSKQTGEWFISETDLGFIAEGVGILGTGKCEGSVACKVRANRLRGRRLCLYYLYAFLRGLAYFEIRQGSSRRSNGSRTR